MNSKKNNDILYKIPNQENKTNNSKLIHKNCNTDELISNFEIIDFENTNENGVDKYFKNSEEINNNDYTERQSSDLRINKKSNSLICKKGLTLNNKISEEDRFISTHLPALNKNTLLNENYKKSDINVSNFSKDDDKNRSFKRHSTFAFNFSKKLNLSDFTENSRLGKNKEQDKKKFTKFDTNVNTKLIVAKTKKSDVGSTQQKFESMKKQK